MSQDAKEFDTDAGYMQAEQKLLDMGLVSNPSWEMMYIAGARDYMIHSQREMGEMVTELKALVDRISALESQG